MAHKHVRSRPHGEFRHRPQVPMPAVEEAEQRRLDVLSPALLAPRQLERRDPRQPQRLTRMREKTASRTPTRIGCAWCRSCGRGRGRDLTHVLEPQQLSARQVCERSLNCCSVLVYRRRPHEGCALRCHPMCACASSLPDKRRRTCLLQRHRMS